MLSDEGAPVDVAATVEAHVLPFLERLHSRDAMAQWLSKKPAARKRAPSSVITLAILHSFSGERERACRLLARLKKKALGGWRERVAEVAAELGCS